MEDDIYLFDGVLCFFAFLDHLDPVWDLLGTQFGHLLGSKWVMEVSLYWPYPVPTLFRLFLPILEHLGPQ